MLRSQDARDGSPCVRPKIPLFPQRLDQFPTAWSGLLASPRIEGYVLSPSGCSRGAWEALQRLGQIEKGWTHARWSVHRMRGCCCGLCRGIIVGGDHGFHRELRCGPAELAQLQWRVGAELVCHRRTRRRRLRHEHLQPEFDHRWRFPANRHSRAAVIRVVRRRVCR